MRRIFISLVAFLAASVSGSAQNATNSPYSQYGYGRLADQSNGAVKGMNGLGLGWREGNQVNFSNPASYSATDSLTFLFDASLSVQVTNFQEGQHKLNANNSSFDYFVGAFRLRKHVGMAFGAMPYSNVGYNYYNQQLIGSDVTGSSSTTCTNSYSGEGGFHQAFLGLGLEPLRVKNTSISLGANVSYIWGDYTKSIVNSYSDDYVNTLSKYYKADVNAFKYDLGLQIQHKFSKREKITLGATWSIGHDMNGTPECQIISTNSQTGVADTTTYRANGRLAMPTTYGVGAVWNHANKVRAGFDYKVEKWGSVKYPVYSVVNDHVQYNLAEGLFADRQRYTLGCEYTPNSASRRWRGHVKYRAGFSYATPYLKINGQEGPKEMSATVGIGLPIMNGWNARSVVNISAQWIQQNATGLIKENTFCISVGLTFNERWFAKWQVE